MSETWIDNPLCVMQDFCKEIHHKIDVIDEERYDLESKVNKSAKEVFSLSSTQACVHNDCLCSSKCNCHTNIETKLNSNQQKY